MRLTAQERATLEEALKIAAHQYRHDAHLCRNSPAPEGLAKHAEAYTAQARACDQLLARVIVAEESTGGN